MINFDMATNGRSLDPSTAIAQYTSAVSGCKEFASRITDPLSHLFSEWWHEPGLWWPVASYDKKPHTLRHRSSFLLVVYAFLLYTLVNYVSMWIAVSRAEEVNTATRSSSNHGGFCNGKKSAQKNQITISSCENRTRLEKIV
jgi:hypothetical protein